VDDLIDVIENFQRAGRVVYIPCLYVLNKCDAITIEELDLLDKVPHYAMISAKDKWGLDDLLEKMWSYMSLVRVYTKPKGRQTDFNAPVICNAEKRSVENLCDLIHKAYARQLKYAWVWGASVRHQPQRVGKDPLLEDEDVIQLVKRI
jgi:ribosome-interacting GTPase 1